MRPARLEVEIRFAGVAFSSHRIPSDSLAMTRFFTRRETAQQHSNTAAMDEEWLSRQEQSSSRVTILMF
jgi:hypothetical protein